MNRLFKNKIHPDDVKALIDFTGGLVGYKSMGEIQSEGVASLYNILVNRDYAFLADEVGMGKTYQAIGLLSLMSYLKNDLRVLIVSPRINLQQKWLNDYVNFIGKNYRPTISGDDIFRTSIGRDPVFKGRVCERLTEFFTILQEFQKQIYFLRHSSFRRPIYIKDDNEHPYDKWLKIQNDLSKIGFSLPDRSRGDLRGVDLSKEINLAFAKELNSVILNLSTDNSSKPIDLIIFDEAQYLRNPDNQTNRIFRTVTENTVNKWLFLSATPIHTGPGDINEIISFTHNTKQPPIITQEVIDNQIDFQKTLRPFLIRRSRKYFLSDGAEVNKTEYRDHIEKPVKSEDISALQYLIMGSIQKYLAKDLDGKNNRVKYGCLASFESLQSSLVSKIEKSKQVFDNIHENDDDSDHDIEQSNIDEKEGRINKEDIPDINFIHKISERFKNTYGDVLPHPKIDFIVDSVFERVKTTGEKFLIFSRRIKAVDEISRKFNLKYEKEIVIKRCKQVWGGDPSKGSYDEVFDDGPDSEIEASEEGIEGTSFLSDITTKGGWLYNYRRSFTRSGKNSLMFEENWFRFFSKYKQIDLDTIFANIPDKLWVESYNSAIKIYNGKRSLYQADRYKNLFLSVIEKYPEIIGVTSSQERNYWLTFFDKIFRTKKDQHKSKETEAKKDINLIKFKSYWDEIKIRISHNDSRCKETFEYIQKEDITDPKLIAENNIDTLLKREIAKKCVWQYIRLTDHLLDLYFADKKNNHQNIEESLNCYFNDYFFSENEHAKILRKDIRNWLTEFDIILKNCIENNDKLSFLAQESAFKEFTNPSFSHGITGSTGFGKTFLKQFKAPGYPKILVCTDVLKEGEDLHLFCDNIIHYGVAFTSGDSEQRVGRVDRYFSQIERNLSKSNLICYPKLDIEYPFILNSIEKYQIERVINRIKTTEKLMDSSIIQKGEESKVFSADISYRDLDEITIQSNFKSESPFIHKFDNIKPGSINVTNKLDHRVQYNNIKEIISQCNGAPRTDNNNELSFNIDGEIYDHEVKFVSELKKYIISITRLKRDSEKNLNYKLREFGRVTSSGILHYLSHSIIIDFDTDGLLKNRYMKGLSLLKNTNRIGEWNAKYLSALTGKLSSIAEVKKQQYVDEHKSQVKIKFNQRSHNCLIYSFDGLIIVASKITDIPVIEESSFITEDIQSWIYKQNCKTDIGYFTEKDNALWFCERIFTEGISDDLTIDILIKITHMADFYEYLITGKDHY